MRSRLGRDSWVFVAVTTWALGAVTTCLASNPASEGDAVGPSDERSILVLSRNANRGGLTNPSIPADPAEADSVGVEGPAPTPGEGPAATSEGVRAAAGPTPALGEDHFAPDDPSRGLRVDPAGSEQPPARTAETRNPDQPIDAEPAQFHGVQPGVTTVEELLESWGAPESTAPADVPVEGSESFYYQIEPFKQVKVQAADGIITLIQIDLKKTLAPSLLAKQLYLTDYYPVVVRDAEGVALGVSFPERGVLMTLAPGGGEPRVTHVVLDQLGAEPFILRAESRPSGAYGANLKDLKFGLQLDPESAKAKSLLARLYLATGQPTRAEAAAASAMAAEPNHPDYRLLQARALVDLGRYEQAVAYSRRVLESKPSALARAEAFAQLGRLGALGSPEESRKSIDLFNQAIAIADKLATSRIVAERRAAKELLVDCHLAIACQIARGDWQKKSTVVPQWIGRASAFAEEAIEKDGGSLEFRLRVAEHALAALSSFQPMPNPSGWVQEAQSTADTLLESSSDTLWQRRIHWELGLAYFHALHIAHVRGDADGAIQLGHEAVTHLGKGARSREALPANEHLVGRLYFRIGAVYAIHREDHENAVAWYEKAAPLLKQPVPVSPYADPRRHGDALVSMGVSFWQVGRREQGLEFTELGADLLTQAAQNGLVGSTALTVAYGNLATMHQALGNELEALQYDALARGNLGGDREGTLRR